MYFTDNEFASSVVVAGPSETRMLDRLLILGQLDELRVLESKYPTIQHPSFSRTRSSGISPSYK
jgi:hypothetical protein